MFLALIILTPFVLTARWYWRRYRETHDLPLRLGFALWLVQGLVIPCLVWGVFNAGLVPGLPPLLGDLWEPWGKGTGLSAPLLRALPPSLLLIGTFWAGMTMVWIAGGIWYHALPRSDFWGMAGFVSAFGFPMAFVAFYLGDIWATGVAIFLWMLPVVQFTMPVSAVKLLHPVYSKAVAKMKFGKHDEAEWDVIQELEKFTDDFEGWMMLAEIYATRDRDVAAAEETIKDLLSQPNIDIVQTSVALHRLADWHLQVDQDPLAARRVLEVICAKAPGSHLDRMARIRIQQLPESREEWIARLQPRVIPLPQESSEKGTEPPFDPAVLRMEEAKEMAQACVGKLGRDPGDAASRLVLVRLMAERLGREEEAMDHIREVLAQANLDPESRQEWLLLLGGYQLRFRKDVDAARSILEQLSQLSYGCRQAFALQRQIMMQEVEERMARHRAPWVENQLPGKLSTRESGEI